MSDTVAVAIVSAVTTVVMGVINVVTTRKQNANIEDINKKVSALLATRNGHAAPGKGAPDDIEIPMRAPTAEPDTRP